MRFFTYKLWQELQGRKFKSAELTWGSNAQRYWTGFDRLKPLLGGKPHSFFRSIGLHDGFVVGFEDGGAKSTSLVVRTFSEVVRLEFVDVRRLQLDYSSVGETPAAFLEWGYEEFSRVGPRILQLEVLFSSGAVLLVRFAKLRVHRQKSG
jgi:hypothetical protein